MSKYDQNPYHPTPVESDLRQVLVSSDPCAFWGIVIPIVAAVGNCMVGAKALRTLLPRSFPDTVEYGWYSGQYVALAVWLTWGTGFALDRISSTIRVGTLFCLAYWLGYGATHNVLPHTHSMAQAFTVLPMAFVLSVLPLLLLRSVCRYKVLGQIRSTRRNFSTACTLGLFLLGVGVALRFEGFTATDLVFVIAIGLLLGVISCLLGVFFSFTILASKVRTWMLPLGVVLASVPGLVAGSMLSFPGPGAASAVNVAMEGCAGGAVAALFPMIYFTYWRHRGVLIA